LTPHHLRQLQQHQQRLSSCLLHCGCPCCCHCLASLRSLQLLHQLLLLVAAGAGGGSFCSKATWVLGFCSCPLRLVTPLLLTAAAAAVPCCNAAVVGLATIVNQDYAAGCVLLLPLLLCLAVLNLTETCGAALQQQQQQQHTPAGVSAAGQCRISWSVAHQATLMPRTACTHLADGQWCCWSMRCLLLCMLLLGLEGSAAAAAAACRFLLKLPVPATADAKCCIADTAAAGAAAVAAAVAALAAATASELPATAAAAIPAGSSRTILKPSRNQHMPQQQ
jgi:hypothetical protein